MSSQYDVLRDHIAVFLIFLSSAPSFWFLLNTSYDHGCHLANRFHLYPNEYEALLIVAGLASYTRFGFQIKAGAWSKFLGGGGDENITINHGCHGGDCGGSGNSDGNSDGDGGGGGGGGGGDGGEGGGSRESNGGVGGSSGDDSDERR
jgi:hypothetical protein